MAGHALCDFLVHNLNLSILLCLFLILLHQIRLIFSAAPATTTHIRGTSGSGGTLAVIITVDIRGDNIGSCIAAVAGVGLEAGAGIIGCGALIVLGVIMIQRVGNVIVVAEG